MRFREIKEVRNESREIERINFEKRLARLDRPMYEDSERYDHSLIDVIGEYEFFNRIRSGQLDRMLEELDKPFD